MCVLTVQSDVGYATHVSTKPLPIWSSSRKDWSDWSMEPAYEFANRARATSVRISSVCAGQTLQPYIGHRTMGSIAASRDERTSDRCAYA